MEGKITTLSLVVRDQQLSVAFYTDRVGFDVKTDVTPTGGSRYVTVGPKGQDLEIALWPIGGATDPSQREISKRWSPGTSPPIVLAVTDCRRTHEELRARGVVFQQDPVDHPWGTTATFVDPDGNLFSMNQPPVASSRRKR